MIALQTLVEVLKYGTDYDRNGSFKPRVWRSTPGGHTHLLGNDWVQAVAPDPDPGPHSTICDRGGSTPSLQKQGPWAMGAMFISPGVFLSPIFGGGGGGRLLGPKTGQYVEKNRQSTLRGRGSGHPSVILYSRFDLIPREGRKEGAGRSQRWEWAPGFPPEYSNAPRNDFPTRTIATASASGSPAKKMAKGR